VKSAREQLSVKFGILLPTREVVMSRLRDPATTIYPLAERAEGSQSRGRLALRLPSG